MEKKVDQSGLRKRGRPAGKHRVPLSLNERRARNALYERERRIEMTAALADLAAAVGSTSSISNSELLATVITHLQQASSIKHSSDLESLKRCNKNLIAQIETLEQRLAEPDDSSISRQDDSSKLSRPAKRKRADVEQDTVCTSVPECSPPEYKCTPPVFSPEQKYCPEPSPPPVCYPEQDLPEPKYSPKPKYSPEPSPPPVCYPEQDFPEPKYSPKPSDSPEPEYQPQLEVHFSPEQKYSLEQEFPMDQQLPADSMSPHILPVAMVSPLSSSSDPLSPDHGTLDYSAYRFAGAQLPTPEYQITSEHSGYILPGPYQHGQMYYEYQASPVQYPSPSSPEDFASSPRYMVPDTPHGVPSPQQYRSGPSSPENQFSPRPFEVPVTQYEVPVSYHQPVFHVPVQPVVGSVDILPLPGNAILPDVEDLGLDPRQVNLLSTEDLISVYL